MMQRVYYLFLKLCLQLFHTRNSRKSHAFYNIRMFRRIYILAFILRRQNFSFGRLSGNFYFPIDSLNKFNCCLETILNIIIQCLDDSIYQLLIQLEFIYIWNIQFFFTFIHSLLRARPEGAACRRSAPPGRMQNSRPFFLSIACPAAVRNARRLFFDFIQISPLHD